MDPVLVEKLIRAGKQTGAISVDEIAAIAPLEDMSNDETALLILELERAGVTVEIDPKLTRRNHGVGKGTDPKSTLDLPEDDDARSTESPISTHGGLGTSGESHTFRRLRTTAMILLFCVLSVAILWFFTR